MQHVKTSTDQTKHKQHKPAIDSTDCPLWSARGGLNPCPGDDDDDDFDDNDDFDHGNNDDENDDDNADAFLSQEILSDRISATVNTKSIVSVAKVSTAGKK